MAAVLSELFRGWCLTDHELRKAEMVGANPVTAEAGIATVLVKTFPESGKIVVTASANGLKTGYWI